MSENKFLKYLNDDLKPYVVESDCCYDIVKLRKEIERLSKEVDMWNKKYNEEYDIINELEKWLEEQIKISQAHDNKLGVNICNTFKNKLKELKGDSSNE